MPARSACWSCGSTLLCPRESPDGAGRVLGSCHLGCGPGRMASQLSVARRPQSVAQRIAPTVPRSYLRRHATPGAGKSGALRSGCAPRRGRGGAPAGGCVAKRGEAGSGATREKALCPGCVPPTARKTHLALARSNRESHWARRVVNTACHLLAPSTWPLATAKPAC